SSVLTFILSQARRDQGANILFWLLGSLDSPPYGRLIPLLLLSAAALAGLCWASPALNLLALGRDTARALGLSVDKALWAMVLLSSLATGLAVTFNGVIPFVGLMVPHMARLLVGADHRWSVPASAVLGAALVLLADALGRWALAPQEIPVGVVTALLGAPFFLVLLRRERRHLG
ncbi:MAG TPA: iron ABC transporter permease, partial [Elusimicrobiota bacterium]|nr:iron ABC transporter permease [Elusimicrobiota bacterium]